jgi:uncharacterized protein
MLSFDIRSLEAHAAVVDDVLSADDPVWEQSDRKPIDGARVSGRLSSAGQGRFYWHGRVQGDVILECSRCLADAEAHVDDEAHVIFAEQGSEDADDPDVYVYERTAADLDLRPALREQWLLAAPAYALCRPDCKGLCLRCGADLNAGPHECAEQATDPRWDALKKLNLSSR